MARSLERYGQLSPVVVCRRQDRYELIDGFKRLGAVRGLAQIPRLSARLMEADERTAKAAIYGLNRAGGRTRELEEAWIIQALVREDGMSQVEVAELLGRHKSWVCRRLALIERLGSEGARRTARGACCRPLRRGRSCGCRRATRPKCWKRSGARRCRARNWAAWWTCGCDAAERRQQAVSPGASSRSALAGQGSAPRGARSAAERSRESGMEARGTAAGCAGAHGSVAGAPGAHRAHAGGSRDLVAAFSKAVAGRRLGGGAEPGFGRRDWRRA